MVWVDGVLRKRVMKGWGVVGQGPQVYRHPKLHFTVRSVPKRGGGPEGEIDKNVVHAC